MSEKKVAVRAEVGVDDDTASPLARINARLKSLAAPGRELRESFKGVGEAVRGVGEHLEDFVKPIAALTAAFSLGGIIESTKHFIETGAAVADTARKLGISAKALDEWNYAASQSGVSSDDLQSSIGRLNRNLVDVASGKNKELPRLLSRLGISIRDSSGHMKSADQLLPELADGFTKLHTPLAQNALALALFGKNGASMIQLMMEGSKGFNEMAGEGRALGVVLDDVAHESAKEADDAIGRLMAAFDGLRNTIGVAVVPEILPLIDSFKDLIKENREAVAANIGSFVKDLVTELKSVDWRAMWGDIRSLFEGFKTVINATVGWKTAIGGLLVLLNAGLVLSVINLGKELYGLGIKMAVVFGAPILAMAGNFVTAIRAGYGAMEALNLVMAANPVGLLVVGIAAAVAAIAGLAYVIYRNWDPIKAYFLKLWEDIKQIFGGFGDFLVGVFTLDFSRAFDGVKAMGLGLLKFFTDIFKGLLDAVKAPIDWINEHLPASSAAPAVPVGRSAAAAFAPRPASQGLSPQALALASGGGGASAGAAAGGQIGVVVDFKNMPQGVRAEATTAGPSIGRVEVGKSRQGAL